MYNDYLMHYGVKGMKWGVRHDQPSVGRRYSNWGKKTSNKMYDKMSSNVEARRQRNKQENWAKNSKNKTVARYGNWVDRTSDKVYDKKIQKIEDRRQRKMQEFGEFDKMLDAKDKAVKAFNEKAKGLKLSPEQKKTAKKIAIGAAVVAGVAITAYGGYKVSQLAKTRAGNQAAVGKFLDAHPDVANSVLSGSHYSTVKTREGFSYHDTVSRSTKASIKDSIKGPSLKGSTSTVQVYKDKIKNPRDESFRLKELERFSAGVNGKNNPVTMTKENKKYYRNLYKNYRRAMK